MAPDALIERLLRDHGPSIYRLAVSLLGDRTLAEDVVQETVLRAWQNLGSFRGESSLKTWVLRIGHNVAISFQRKRRDNPTDGIVLEAMLDERPRSDVERDVAAKLSVEALWGALGELDDDSRAIVVLREVEHLSYEEISSLLDLPMPTVKTRLFRARRRLADAVGGESR